YQLLNASLSVPAIERLADADAFRSIGLDRRRALWEVTALKDALQGLFKGMDNGSLFEQKICLPDMPLSEHVLQNYNTLGLSLKAHPVSFVRAQLYERQVMTAKQVVSFADGTRLRVAGLVLVRQRPGTAKNICFITLEDE